MRIVDLNTFGGIGANSIFVELGPFRFVIDAGMNPKFVGNRALPDFRQLKDLTLDFVLLTHCHLDHLGGLPVLMRYQPDTCVFSSTASKEIAPRMLLNSCAVMKRQKNESPMSELPLYSRKEVRELNNRIMPVPYNRSYVFHGHGDEIVFNFQPAGHVLGASGVIISYKNRKILITGDVLFAPLRTLSGAQFTRGNVDTLIMETTRGMTERPSKLNRETQIDALISSIDKGLGQGGSVLIPVFAFGRMQEILTLIAEARSKGKLRHSPIYTSGLGMDLAKMFDSISRKTGLVNFRKRLFKELQVQPLPRDLETGKLPAPNSLYVLSSGMLVENTPSYKIAASLLGGDENTICWVGYCDPDTPGGRLLAARHGDLFLFDSLDFECRIEAQIEKFDLSGHADREELVQFALDINPRVIVLTHGEETARNWFRNSFKELIPRTRIVDPEPLESYVI